ncbi:hypothetical protein ACVJ19_001564 [Bradyrhizobium sp. USDA 376]
MVDALSTCAGFALSAAASWMMAQLVHDPDAVTRQRP